MVGVRSVGDWIGDRFEIFDVHEGGMSLVYVVHDHLGKSGRTVVALKTLKVELLGHKIRRSRFATECRLWDNEKMSMLKKREGERARTRG